MTESEIGGDAQTVKQEIASIKLTPLQLAWYQSDAVVIVSFTARELQALGLEAEKVLVTINERQVKLEQDGDKNYELVLNSPVILDKSEHVVVPKAKGACLEVILFKIKPERWPYLLDGPTPVPKAVPKPAVTKKVEPKKAESEAMSKKPPLIVKTADQPKVEVTPTVPAPPPPVTYRPPSGSVTKIKENQVSFYQTESNVVVTLLARQLAPLGLEAPKLTVNINPEVIEIVQDDFKYELELSNAINPDTSTYKVIGYKLEVKLTKVAATHWILLIKKDDATPDDMSAPVKQMFKRKQELDALIKEVEEEEKKNPGENDVFKMLYEGADDDARRAMQKSMYESGGRSLSMSWGEAKKKNYAKDYDKTTGELKTTSDRKYSDSDTDSD